MNKTWLDLRGTRRTGAIILILLVLAASLSSCNAKHDDSADLSATSWEVSVIGVDKYGSATIDLAGADLFSAGYEYGDVFAVKVGGIEFDAPFVTNFSDVNIGQELLRDPGTPNNLVMATNMGNFAGAYDIGVGTQVSITISEKSGYLETYNLRQLARTYDREDYASDEIFANFREATVGGIAPGVLYRSSSPVNNEYGRAEYAGALAERAGIATIINLADSQEKLMGYFSSEDVSTDFYETLFDDGRVIYLDMGVDLTSDDFRHKLRDALTFLAENEAPFLIHCNEGKDRAGFALALIEALMGADVDEIVADYMLSFVNYYHIELGSKQYEAVAEGTIMIALRIIAGLDFDADLAGADLAGVDLQAAAEEYIAALGVAAENISKIKANLSDGAT